MHRVLSRAQAFYLGHACSVWKITDLPVNQLIIPWLWLEVWDPNRPLGLFAGILEMLQGTYRLYGRYRTPRIRAHNADQWF